MTEVRAKTRASLIRSLVFGLGMVVLAFVSLGAWAFASPVGSSPDEDYHLASIWCGLGDRDGLCEPGEKEGQKTVLTSLIQNSGCYLGDNEQSAECVTFTSDMVSTDRGNFLGAYPPVFYGSMGILASDDVPTATIHMRLLNAAIFVGIVTLLLALLKPAQRAPLLWGVTAAIVPLGVFLIASVNPSSWAILSGSTLWLALVGYFTADTGGRRVALGLLSFALAIGGAGSRGDSAVYVAIGAVVACILTFEHTGKWWRRAILPIAIVVIGALFYFSASQTTHAITQNVEPPPLTWERITASILMNLPRLPSLWVGNLGTWGLGWLDTTMPPFVWVTMIAVLAAVAFWGLRKLPVRKALALAFVVVALVAFPMYIVVRDQVIIGSFVQPRYIFPLVLLFAGLIVYGFDRVDLDLTRFQGFVILFGVAMANSLALYTNMRRYITGFDYTGFNLGENAEWWWSVPIGPMSIWFVGSAAFALLLLGVLIFVFRGQGLPPRLASFRASSQS